MGGISQIAEKNIKAGITGGTGLDDPKIAALANEAGIPYAAVAMSTDYDCLFDDVAPVTWDEILHVFKENVDKVVRLLTNAIPRIE